MRQVFHLHARRRRAQRAVFVLLFGIGSLAFSFFQTQVLKNTAYALRSEENRLRPLSIPAPRGTIYDRNGRIVAENVPGYALSLLPAERDTVQATLERLAPFLDLSPSRIETLLARRDRLPSQPLLVSDDLSFEQVSAVEERRPSFPGVHIDMRPKRRYPPGKAVGHLVGFVAEISQAELEQEQFREYSAGEHVGKAGIEREYEPIIAGRPGLRYVEVDAHGRIIGELAPQPRVNPIPGKDLQLNLDLGLQEWIAELFPDTVRAAVVALEPRTGHVLAFHSSPSYDPNLLIGGVSPEVWQELTLNPDRPLLNRAVTGTYPPGSTFKLAAATMALELGVLDPDAHMPIPCRGGMRYAGRYFRCSEPAGHGFLTLAEAIQGSCNVYFYQVGLKLGLEQFLESGARMGLTRRTGIDFPVENASIFPSDPDWYRTRFGNSPTPSEVMHLSIGQGPVDQTVLKVAQFYAALAGDGYAPPPRLARTSESIGESEGLQLNLSPEQIQVLRQGLSRVVGPGGTAHLSSLEHWDFAGKTGTAQNPRGADHGWFVGMAGPRGEDPEIVIAAIIQFGEHGSWTANYVAKIADYYLRTQRGMEVDTVQTLRDHLDAGRAAPWARWQ